MTTRRFKLTVLVEDRSDRNDIFEEYGWSVLIEHGRLSGLFDTGQTDLLCKNASALGVDLSRLSWVVLSHGHYDHTGGLKGVLDVAARPVVYAHPDVFIPKYIKERNGSWREAGMSLSMKDIEQCGAEVRLGRRPTAIQAGIGATGEIPRKTSFEKVQARFFVEKDNRRVHDRFPDDQSLILETRKGIVVLLGCCHAGVVNTLRYVRKITEAKRTYAVIGGMYLGAASRERIRRTTHAFLEYDVSKIGLAHCTGRKAEKEFMSVLGERCFLCPAGTVLEF